MEAKTSLVKKLLKHVSGSRDGKARCLDIKFVSVFFLKYAMVVSEDGFSVPI